MGGEDGSRTGAPTILILPPTLMGVWLSHVGASTQVSFCFIFYCFGVETILLYVGIPISFGTFISGAGVTPINFYKTADPSKKATLQIRDSAVRY